MCFNRSDYERVYLFAKFVRQTTRRDDVRVEAGKIVAMCEDTIGQVDPGLPTRLKVRVARKQKDSQ
jgi:hypothetical protein